MGLSNSNLSFESPEFWTQSNAYLQSFVEQQVGLLPMASASFSSAVEFHFFLDTQQKRRLERDMALKIFIGPYCRKRYNYQLQICSGDHRAQSRDSGRLELYFATHHSEDRTVICFHDSRLSLELVPNGAQQSDLLHVSYGELWIVDPQNVVGIKPIATSRVSADLIAGNWQQDRINHEKVLDLIQPRMS